MLLLRRMVYGIARACRALCMCSIIVHIRCVSCGFDILAIAYSQPNRNRNSERRLRELRETFCFDYIVYYLHGRNRHAPTHCCVMCAQKLSVQRAPPHAPHSTHTHTYQPQYATARTLTLTRTALHYSIVLYRWVLCVGCGTTQLASTNRPTSHHDRHRHISHTRTRHMRAHANFIVIALPRNVGWRV